MLAIRKVKSSLAEPLLASQEGLCAMGICYLHLCISNSVVVNRFISQQIALFSKLFYECIISFMPFETFV